ncbi:hypothetical protein SAMN05216353_10439 [Halobacillus alkaliphilus]|uniref:Uncharacterized protein n=1 Tax=Halobacillus alkaliphilus TaxID=396056 RepID=A0A1I2KGW2_9BACI|nr:hypothetical protein [Halobacillus alkaliphilus]SFF64361.1 hypothetical protein SAMN05216353_10439 [Halobacillus alkaliphilus]
MRKSLKLILGMFFFFALIGCIAEDYDVGVPTAHLYIDAHYLSQSVQLTEANISWSSSNGKVEETFDDIEEYGRSQGEIKVFPGQDASLEFKENKENGGDIWSAPTITAVLWKNGEKIKIDMNEYREFRFPTEEGNYILEATFKDESNTAQYVGNIVINDDTHASR